MWNYNTSEDQAFVLPTKRNISSSAFLFGSGVFLLFLLAAGGYSIFELRSTILKSNQVLVESLQRDSVLVFSNGILTKMVSMFETSQPSLVQYNSMLSEFNQHRARYTSAKAKYLSLVENSKSLMDRELLSIAKQYFSQADALIHKIVTSLSMSVKEERYAVLREPSSIRIAFYSVVNRNFQDLRLTERKYTLEQESNKDHIIRAHTLRWFVLFIVIIGFSIVLIILLIHRDRKISYELKRFHALFEYSTSPVQVTDSGGVIRYANPAFIQWSGMSSNSFVGRNLFDVMKISNQEKYTEGPWMSAKPTLASGKTWFGEVEFTSLDGRTAVSRMVLSPVLDTHGKLIECIALHNDLTERKEYEKRILETQRQYRSIVESSLDGIMIIQDGKLVYVNPSAVRLFGYASTEEMQKLNFADTIATSNRSFLQMEQGEHVIGEEVLRNDEMRGQTKQGKMIDLEVNAHIIEWNDRLGVQASFRDITRRKMLEREQSLWLWEQETLSNIDRKLVGILDLEKIFTAILQQTLNLTRAHFAGVLLFDESQSNVQWKAIRGNTLQHTLESFAPSEPLTTILKKEAPNIIHNSDDNNSFSSSQIPVIGEEKLISTAWMPLIVEGKQKGMLVVGYRHYHEFVGREMRLLVSLAEKHSIAMVNAQLYTDLLQREKELEILTGARVQAQEDERRRIAREIHDGLGQMLTAIKFNLEILEDMITAGQEERDRIADMKGLLDSVMKEAREISYNLMPSVLDDFGLAPALQLLSEQFTNRTAIKVQFHTHGITERLDPQLEIGLYRIAQESFNNVAKHAEATEINLQLIRHADGLRLVIEDNGKGIVIQPNNVRATGKGGMGLVSMRERASSFGGILTIDSTPKSGTLVTVEIPLTKSISHG